MFFKIRSFRWFILLIGVTTLLTNSCSNKDKKSHTLNEVIRTSFGEEIKDKSNLSFTFNHSMIDDDSLINKWINRDYFNITPKVEGRYKWISTDELIFSPVSGFENATNYELSFNKDLLLVNKKSKNWAGLKTYTFHTPFLKLTELYAIWSKEEDGSIKPKLTAIFNFPVSSEILKKNLKVEINNKEFSFEVSNKTNDVEHTILLIENPDRLKQENIRVTLGLIDKICIETVSKSAKLEPTDKLKIIKIETSAVGIEAIIKVFTSQKIETDSIANKLTITPNIKYKIVTTAYGFDISSEEIKLGNGYNIKIKEGLVGELGGKLKNEYVQDVYFGEVSPEIAFNNEKALYLGKMGNKNISVKIIGVPKLKISVYKIFENNLIHFISRGKNYGYYYNDEDENADDNYYSYNYYETSDVGQLVHEEEIESKDLEDVGISKLLKFDFTDKLKDMDGIYVIKIQDSEKYYISDSKLISLSDIGIISKEDKESMYVFCNSIKTAKPIAGTEVKLISTHNQVIASSKTNTDGIAIFSKLTFLEGFEPGLVITKNGEDYNFMRLDNAEYITARFDVGGKRSGENPYDLFLYAERSLYRPGETIHLAGMLRDFAWKTIKNMPVNIILKSPDGKEYASTRQQLNEQGMFSGDFTINANSMTGTYIAEAYTGKDIYLGSKTIQVEEFMPDRIKVDLNLDKEIFEVGDSIKGTVLAANYFGPPAVNSNYEVQLTISQGNFAPKNYKNYLFDLNNPIKFFDQLDNGKTNNEGKAAIRFQIPENLKNSGVLNGRIYATVFDETGRPVHRSSSFKINTQKVFLGMGDFDSWVNTKKPLEIPLIALDKNEKLIEQKAEIEVIQYVWHSNLRYDGARYSYVSEKETNSILKETITIKGDKTKYYFTPNESGSYEILIKTPESSSSVVKSFYAYGYEDTYNTSFEVDTEGNIDISFDKESYQPGEKAIAILKLPFDGKVLITTERDKILSYVYLNSKDKVVTYPITVSDKHVPNTYVTATLFKAHTDNSLPLTVAHGFASFEVKPKKAILNLTVNAIKKSRSKTKQTITITSEPNTHLTVAVVDEGILALGSQKTPDPYNYFYSKRALEVNSSDLYPFLFPEVTATGGDEADMEAEMANRQNPLKNNRVKLVSFWSNLLKTDANGKVSFEVDIPQFSGSLRIMAVACKNEKFGSLDENITVADPLVISSSIPRFLSMGDEWKMTVNMANTTDKLMKGKLNVQLNGPLSMSGLSGNSVEIPANGEKEITLNIKADYKIDVAKIITTVEALGEKFQEETDITIRPAASLVKQYCSGIIKAGESKTINFSNNFLAATGKHKIFISRSPLAQFTKQIDHLISYPFGCIEQTVSKAFPQLYFEDLIAAIGEGQNDYNANEIKRNIQVAIDKIKTMQLSNGGLSYWPNGGNESWWGTIYATHFLIEAKEKGFQVNSKVMNRMLDYLKDRLMQKEKEVYYYNGTLKKDIIKKEIPYSLYVLALVGKPDFSSMKYYLSNPEELSLDGKYLLASSFVLTNDLSSSKRILPSSFAGEQSLPSDGGSFYSYIRDLAISTDALINVQPDHPQIPDMIKLLSQEMNKQSNLNTQEICFGFMAMGKYARLNSIGKASATISCNGKSIDKFDGKDLWINSKNAEPMVINVIGDGSIYYYVENQGIPINDKIEDKDNYLKVRRTYFTRDKQVITSGKFKQNDLVVVKVTLQSITGKTIENVAITDILPAGFEIENARITDMPELSWISSEMSYDYRDIRDDRIHFFTTATKDVQTFYYLVRAVTSGTYQLGPVSADAMYNGQFYSYHGSGKVIVE